MKQGLATKENRPRIAAWRAFAIVGPPAFVVLTGVLLYLSIRGSRQAADLVDHSHGVGEVAVHLLARATDGETGQRGYILTGDKKYLQPYANARADVMREVATLQSLTSDNPVQRARADSLSILADRKFKELAATIELRENVGFDSAREAVLLDSGKVIMDSARVILKNLEAEEARLMKSRRESEDGRDRVALIVGLLGLLLSVLFALIMSGRLSNALTASEKAQRDLGIANDDLNEQAMELEMSNEELQAQTEELQSQTEELQSQSDQLEARANDLLDARKEADEKRNEAVRATEAKSQFLANMSHELRTPLNAIAGYIQLLEMELHGPINEAQRNALERVNLAQRHLLGLINDILNLTRIQSGKLHYDIVDVDLGDVLQDVDAMIRPQLEANHLAYETRLSHDDCIVRADADKLRQILLNLLGNSLKFTPANGRITAEVKPMDGDPERVHVDITDTGIGIPPEKLATIFDPFVQVQAQLTRSRDGTGLGLAISRDLARGMGGDLTVRSVEGEGSTFTVILKRSNS